MMVSMDFPVSGVRMGERLLRWFLLFLVVLVPWTGCKTTRTVWKSQPDVLKSSNPYFNVELSVHCDEGGCTGFNLFLENKTNKDLEIDWGRTFYLSQRKESGGFVFEGIILKDKKLRKPSEIVVAHGVLSKRITPETLVYPDQGWRYRNMGPGDHGILLSVKVDGREINERLNLNLLGMVMEENTGFGFQDSREVVR
jgi:hypothetical protein